MKPALFFIASALAGAALGARLTLMVPDDILRYGLLVVLPIVALVVLKRKDFALTKKEAEHPRFALALFFAFIIGMYDGFYGPGTGTFLILSLTGVAGYAIHHAVGYTKVINLSSNVSSLIVFLANGRVVIPLAGAAIIFSVAGQYIGAKPVSYTHLDVYKRQVKDLLSLGIQPDIVVCRTDYPLEADLRKKIALFCNVPVSHVIENTNRPLLYDVVFSMQREGLDRVVLNRLRMEDKEPDLGDWQHMVWSLLHPEKTVNIALVGKYASLRLSLIHI